MNTVYICVKAYNELIKLAAAHKRGYPQVFLCGEDKAGIIRKLFEVTKMTFKQEGLEYTDSCSNMIALGSKKLAKAYIKAAKAKLTIAGMVRLHHHFQNNGYVIGDTGPILNDCGKYLISVDRNNFVIERGKNNRYNTGRGRLTVLITNKLNK